MSYYRFLVVTIALSTNTTFLSGCATYKTISAVKYGSSSPRIYSGTRLNIHAISNDHTALKKFNVTPPEYPILDLPISFSLDTLILPITVSSVLSQKLGL
ncbi:YceK/YidQ family lipoprotein [Nitrosomonas sp.]|uniref:YceK/YidQ family lipoprotein n=1 Tax=Nitrosomonas sp. TaxID=42353 RepID=UPI00284935DC|nr:YceK/YidQ family lipoprotein [Nitrosomonas sp.]MDR4515388.1 YceK/YidQ family lipoprotein [Nitrosomonas sp.]